MNANKIIGVIGRTDGLVWCTEGHDVVHEPSDSSRYWNPAFPLAKFSHLFYRNVGKVMFWFWKMKPIERIPTVI